MSHDRKHRYVTTAIDYPNAAPHMGHVLEKVLADVVARWFRLQGDAVLFQTGTDEHGIKIQQTAEKEGITPAELTDRNVPLFQNLYTRLHISYDRFLRTTDRKVHWPTVVALWGKLREEEMLEKRSYTGLYCSGCERFLTKRDLEDGLCPTHQKAPEEVREENWFFALSRKEDWLKKLLMKGEGSYEIVPGFRAAETLSLIEQGLEDVSFSRPVSSLTWGIPVPDDAQQVMYVWCDALTNYISGLGYFTDHEERMWWDDAEVTHVIGKDIARFHALIWPAMLDSAGVRTPDRLLIHGFLTSEGKKMSKSLGNVVKPDDVLAMFGGNPDPLRFYLSHEVPVGNDGDFSWKRIEELYNAKLRNQLGNLLNRVLVLLGKDAGELSSDILDYNTLHSIEIDKYKERIKQRVRWNVFEESMDNFHLHLALQEIFSIIEFANVFIQEKQPWTMKEREDRLEILTILAEFIRQAALMLLPFVPTTAQEITRQLGVPYADRMTEKDFVILPEWREWGGGEKLQKEWKTIGEPSILFPPLSETIP